MKINLEDYICLSCDSPIRDIYDSWRCLCTSVSFTSRFEIRESLLPENWKKIPEGNSNAK